MKRSCRELPIDIIIHRGIFKNKQITLFPCFTVIHKSGDSFIVIRLGKFTLTKIRYLVPHSPELPLICS